MTGSDTNTAIRAYLQARYSVTNQDLATLIDRYLAENPNGLADQTAVMAELIAAAQAA